MIRFKICNFTNDYFFKLKFANKIPLGEQKTMPTQTGAFRGAGVISEQSQTLPSVFDIWAQQSLAESIKPALKHLAKFLSNWYPKESKTTIKWLDEFYLAFSLFLENYYLKNYGK